VRRCAKCFFGAVFFYIRSRICGILGFSGKYKSGAGFARWEDFQDNTGPEQDLQDGRIGRIIQSRIDRI